MLTTWRYPFWLYYQVNVDSKAAFLSAYSGTASHADLCIFDIKFFLTLRLLSC